MAGLAARQPKAAQAAVSCTCSTTRFQNSRNEVLAFLAEVYGNSSAWSQHVTNGIMNMLYSITSFVTFWNQSRSPFGWLWPWLGISLRNVSRTPKCEKVMLIMSSWWMSSAKTQTFCQGAFRASNTKTNMTNGIQLLTVAVFFIFKCARTKLETSDPGISNKFWYRRLHLLKAKVSTFSSCGQWFIEPSHFHVTCSWLFVGFFEWFV